MSKFKVENPDTFNLPGVKEAWEKAKKAVAAAKTCVIR